MSRLQFSWNNNRYFSSQHIIDLQRYRWSRGKNERNRCWRIKRFGIILHELKPIRFGAGRCYWGYTLRSPRLEQMIQIQMTQIYIPDVCPVANMIQMIDKVTLVDIGIQNLRMPVYRTRPEWNLCRWDRSCSLCRWQILADPAVQVWSFGMRGERGVHR